MHTINMVTPGNTTQALPADQTLQQLNAAGSPVRTLAHELAGLIDAAGRSARLAEACLDRAVVSTNADPDIAAAQLHLHRASTALDFAAEALRTTVRAVGAVGTVGTGGGTNSTPAPSRRLADNTSTPTTLREAIDHAIELHTPLARQHAVEMHTDIDPAAAAHPASRFFNVISNALRNAVQAASRRGHQAGGRVTLRATIRNERLIMEVHDNGPGPTDEALARAFVFGYSTTGGEGVGLAVSRRTIEDAGGTITLSRGPNNRGAVLRTELPAHPSQPTPNPNPDWPLNEWGE
jgi:signal transduction histidine kinase